MHNSIRYGLVAAAVTAALGFSSLAAAETTVYGKLHLSVGRTTSQDTATGTKYSANQVKSHASRFGFKADKVLDNGMTVTGQLEYEVDTVGDKTNSSQTDYIKSRNSYFGLKGGFGDVRVGIHDLPSKISTGSLDPFSDTYADYNNVLMADDRKSNTILYLNKFGDFDFGASYSAGDDTGTSTATENKNSTTSVMLNYKSGPLFLSASTVSYADRTTGQTESSPKFGVGYTISDVKLGLVYESDSNKDAKDDTATYASLQWKVSDTGTIKAGYGKLDYGDTTKKDPTFYAVGYDYKLDKSATLYVLYANGKDGGLANKGKLTGDGSAMVLGATYSF